MSFHDEGSPSQPITWVQRDDPFLRPIVGPTSKAHTTWFQYYLWHISWKAQSLSWTTYELFTLWVNPVHRSAHSMVNSTLRAWVILRIRSNLTSWVTPYGLDQLISQGILSCGSLHEYGQFLLDSLLCISNHVTSYRSYMTLRAHYGLQCSIIAINFVTLYNPTVPLNLHLETLGPFLSISTQRDTTFGGHIQTYI